MPLLDVSELALDIDMSDAFQVQRKTEVVNSFGESTIKIETFSAYGVITAGSGNRLHREPDQQHMSKSLHIVTKFRLQGPSPGKQADWVVWHGDRFVILHLDDYSAFGQGFIQATCTSVDTIDQPPPAALP